MSMSCLYTFLLSVCAGSTWLERQASGMHIYQVMTIAVVVFQSQDVACRCLTDFEEVSPKRYFHSEGQTLDIRLEVSRRISHQLATAIFHVFLKEVLGYPLVSTVDHQEHSSTLLAVERLSGHSSVVPMSMVNLEVWIPAEIDITEFTKVYHVKDCGALAPPGRFGWFIPAKLANIADGMDHWRVLTKLDSASLFAMTEEDLQHVKKFTKLNSTNKYFCEEKFCKEGMHVPDWCQRTQLCAVLLAGYTDETSFVVQHIAELKLFVQVLWVGPHLKHVVETMASRYEAAGRGLNTRSLLLLTRMPSTIVMPGDARYVSIAFPPCEMSETSAGIGCKYELQRLVKLAWSKLEVGAKPAFEALHKMSFSFGDLHNLLELYSTENNVSKVACDWMLKNRARWQHWIPTNDDMNVLYIGGIFPMSSSLYNAKGIVKAADMAMEAVNTNSTILRDYVLKMQLGDGECKAESVMKNFIYYVLFNVYKKLVGILGPGCSDTVEPLAGVTKHFRTVVISYSAEGASFSDRSKYPYFFRTIGENKQYKHVYLQLLQQLGWEQVAALTEDGQKYTEYISHLQDLLQANGITFVANRKFPRDRDRSKMSQYLEELKSKGARIIIGDMFDDAARDVMCEAYQLKMTAKEGYVWFLPLWLSPDWYNTDYHNTRTQVEIPCNTSQMIQAINGHLAVTHAYFAHDTQQMQEGITVGEWREKYKKKCKARNIPESNYAGYAYDAVWTFALALNNLMKENQSYLSDIHSETSTRRFVELIEATDFQGVSGRIRFLGGPSRASDINVIQWLSNKTYVVGSFYPNISTESKEIIGGTLDLNVSAITWLTPNGQPPADGKEPAQLCVLNGLATLLDVSCEAAIVTANIIGFGLLGLLLIIAFIVVKRRYDKKVQMTKNYMKSLGIDLLSMNNMTNLDKWEISRDRVVINRKLGEGAFGTVYGGEALFDDKGWVAVAVKTLKVGSTTEEKLDFLSEAEVMKRFEHKNIVKLLAVCTKNEPVYTVMEFMLYGDLKTFLLARRHLVNEKEWEESDEISSKKLTTMALDVARALSYLAELKYVHRDVACRNCLVNVSRVVKLGDFGMTRPMYESDYYKFSRKGMLPVRWMAPESLALGIFTPSSDVWSYGVLLYEIVTFGSFPFQGMSNNQVLEHVKAGNTLTIPSGIKPQLEGLIRSCWNHEYKKRPNASEIVEFLATNPRLITPSLDVPLASVQIEDTGQFELQLPEVPRRRLTAAEHPAFYMDSDGHTATQEPLLRDSSPCSSTSSSGLPLTQYIPFQPTHSLVEDYCNHNASTSIL